MTAATLLAVLALATPTLHASVGDPLRISVTAGGKPVKTLRPGTYRIVVSDTSSGHNFRLSGPGVNRTTSIAAAQTATWIVRLRKGVYRYVCDPHASFMKGSFTVR
jgi:alpha-D-ribose 1-methylphosphonate 5-triphosphate synthase subunit PhnH